MKRTRKRIISVLIAAMMVAMLPAAAFAAAGTDGTLAGGNYYTGSGSAAFTTKDLVLGDGANAAAVKLWDGDGTAEEGELIDISDAYPINIPFGATLTVGTLVETADTAAAATAAAPFSILDTSNAYGVVVPKGEIADAALNLVAGEAIGDAVDFAANVTAAIGDYIVIVDGTSPDDQGTVTGATLKYAVFAVQQGTGGVLEGDASLKTPIYNVVAPTTLAYAVDPLALGVDTDIDAENTQISSSVPYAFANGTAATPVRVTVNLEVTAAGNAVLQDGETFTPDDTPNAAKQFSLGVVGATTITGATTYASPTEANVTFKQNDLDATESSTIRYFDPAASNAVAIDFLLAPGSATETLNTDTDLGVGLFKLYGQMNTYPATAWAKGDITIAGTYTLGGIKATDYKESFSADATANTTIADDPATKFDESTLDDVDDPQTDYDAWRGGLKGTTSRDDALEVTGVNVWPLANPTPPPVQNGETAETPYILTAGVPKVVVFHTSPEERGSVYLKLDGADPDLTPIFGVNNQMPSGADTSSGIFLQMVRPDQSVAVQTAADFSFEDGILRFTPSVASGAAGARTLNIVTPTATYRVDYSSDYTTSP